MFEVNKTYSTKFSNEPTTERIYIFTSKFNKINKSVVHPTFYMTIKWDAYKCRKDKITETEIAFKMWYVSNFQITAFGRSR